MSRKVFGIITFITALTISGCAAYYSVFGLSKLFSGATTQVIIMASSLEFGKLVCASLLQRYWNELDKLKRIYLSIATVMLIFITSVGIYGFLFHAYQITADKDTVLEKKLGVLEMKKSRYSDQVIELKSEQSKVTESISQLRTSLSTGSTNQYLDKKSGQILSTVSTSAQKTFSGQLDEAVKRRDILSAKIESASDSVASYEIAIINEKSKSSVSSEIGPLKNLSSITGRSMDTTVGWFILFIIIIFDPLAIILLTTANYLFFKKEIIEQVPASEPASTPSVSVQTESPSVEWVQVPVTESSVQDIISGSMIDSSVIPEVSNDIVDTNTTDDFNTDPIITVPISQSEIPVIEIKQVSKPTLIETDINKSLAERIRKVLPWWNNEVSGSEIRDISLIPDEEELTDRHKNNMTQEQIKEWYRNHKKSDG